MKTTIKPSLDLMNGTHFISQFALHCITSMNPERQMNHSRRPTAAQWNAVVSPSSSNDLVQDTAGMSTGTTLGSPGISWQTSTTEEDDSQWHTPISVHSNESQHSTADEQRMALETDHLNMQEEDIDLADEAEHVRIQSRPSSV